VGEDAQELLGAVVNWPHRLYVLVKPHALRLLTGQSAHAVTVAIIYILIVIVVTLTQHANNGVAQCPRSVGVPA